MGGGVREQRNTKLNRVIKGRAASARTTWTPSGSQAQSFLTFIGAPAAYPRSEQIRLGRIVARRMASAMRRG